MVYIALTHHIFNYQLSTINYDMGSIWLFNSPCGLYVFVRCFFHVFFGLAWVRGRIVMNPSAVWPIWQFQTVFFCWLDLLCFVFCSFLGQISWYHHDWPRKFGPLLQIFRAPSADLMGLKCVANDSWPSNLFCKVFNTNPKWWNW